MRSVSPTTTAAIPAFGTSAGAKGVLKMERTTGYRSYNFRDVLPRVAQAVLGTQTATYPLQITPIGSGRDTVSSTNQSGSGTYYSLGVIPNAAPTIVKFVNATPNNLLNCCLQIDKEWRRRFVYPGAHLYVLRVQ